ncbi:unnamed protein product [Parnassius mnemosyne]|uniref:Uncharacterized protein n=1 Tax=Parnassius mnemosyne TaxID=213953 RepID=A0AAV1LCD2_9NEOP
MPPSVKSRRILCINCNVCLSTFRRYLVHELNTRVISLLSDWISPVIITEEDYICERCNELLLSSINQQLTTICDGAQESGSSQPGRRQVCSICGWSTLNRQSHSIVFDNPSEEQRQINALYKQKLHHVRYHYLIGYAIHAGGSVSVLPCVLSKLMKLAECLQLEKLTLKHVTLSQSLLNQFMKV